MPARPLVLYPDPRLRQPAGAVESFGPDLAMLAGDLADTLAAVQAIGLTAPHIGVGLRLVAIRLEPGEPTRLYANPLILSASAETESHEEGSVSMPGMRERIERPRAIRLRYQDPDGASHEDEAEGWSAAVLQHELDQLDGIFWIDRLSRLKRDRLLKRYAKAGRGS